jgi:predicted lipid-binding transport protein (Tim44 family)
MARVVSRCAALLALMLGAVGTALGRVGGGGHAGASHSSSGGHSSGSFHSSGGGAGGGIIALLIIALIIWLVMRRLRSNPAAAGFSASPPEDAAQARLAMPRAAMQPVANPAAQVALSALAAALGSAQARAGIGAPAGNASPTPLPAGLEAIRAADPDFELETFLQRAEMCFFLVKRGIQKNDALLVRPYLNDAVYAQVSQNLARMKQQHVHALLESLNVRAVHLQNALSNEQGQTIQVHFDLVYRSKTLDDANRVVADEREDGRHGEQWTFTRAATARTPQNGGVIASRCPACGAELRLNLDGTCAHCRASVTSGKVDWVVADVQTVQFMGYSGESPFGVAAATVAEGITSLQAADPAFSLEAFRARAGQAFMALQAAWCNQNLDGGRAFLSPGAYFAWSAQLETMAAEGRRNIMEHVQVRGIDALRVIHGRVFDDLTVRISAVAADFEVDKNNNIVFGDRTVRPFTEDWTFQRSVGVATSGKPGTLENTCPSCGAPVALTQIGECRYCKAAVTSGKFDWVVSRIEQEDDESGSGGSGENTGSDLAMQVGGAIVGGLLGSLLSGSSSRNSNDW